MHRTAPILAATLLAPALLAPAALAQIAAGPVMNPSNGHRYARTAPMTLNDARAYAASIGGRMATVHNATLNAWIRANVASAGGNTTPCSLGLNDLAVEGTFVWENDDPVFYTNWNAGEPNNQNNEDVAAINPATGRWNDIITTIPVPAIIEVEGPIRVPGEYGTIQAAIDAALDGQTILVAPGVYVENIDFLYKHLIVRSEAGAERTTIRTVRADYGVILAGGQGRETVLEGFTIRPHAAPPGELVYLANGQVLRACRVWGGAAASLITSGDAVISDCLLLGPSIALVAVGPGPTTVQNCTIAGTVFLQNNAAGPTIINAANCIIRGSIVEQSTGRLKATFSDIQGFRAGEGNFDAPPAFVSAPGPDGFYDLDDDYHLAQGSPCIDAGSNTARQDAGPMALARDLDLADRLADDPTRANARNFPGALVDLGAYERAPATPACPVDFNADGFVDFFDYDDFVAAFENGC